MQYPKNMNKSLNYNIQNIVTEKQSIFKGIEINYEYAQKREKADNTFLQFVFITCHCNCSA